MLCGVYIHTQKTTVITISVARHKMYSPFGITDENIYLSMKDFPWSFSIHVFDIGFILAWKLQPLYLENIQFAYCVLFSNEDCSEGEIRFAQQSLS